MNFNAASPALLSADAGQFSLRIFLFTDPLIRNYPQSLNAEEARPHINRKQSQQLPIPRVE